MVFSEEDKILIILTLRDASELDAILRQII